MLDTARGIVMIRANHNYLLLLLGEHCFSSAVLSYLTLQNFPSLPLYDSS